jgi:hypothetical protein
VTLYKRLKKTQQSQTEDEMRESILDNLRKENEERLKEHRGRIQKVMYMNPDQLRQHFESQQATFGYPDERRMYDEDKAWCNDQVVQAAASTEGRIYLLDAKNFGSSRNLIRANVDARRIFCPQYDAATYGDMLLEQACDQSLLHVRVVEGTLGHHLSKDAVSSIGVVFADYTGMWSNSRGTDPKRDMMNLLAQNKMCEDGKVFITITLQRQSVESVFGVAWDMESVFRSYGWSVFTVKTYDMMAFLGFKKN